MIESIHIRDFAIVKRLELSFAGGLTVLTGETGAGKSILIDALALALGGRADVGVVRQGASRAEVAAGFSVKPASAAGRWLAAHDLESDGECLLRRVVEVERGSKGFINGRPVPIQMLRELGEHLVDIHGQHEHQSLLRRDAQREIVDDYAGLTPAVAALGQCYESFRTLEARREALLRQGADRGARVELLRFQVQELEALNLTREEIPELEAEHTRLANGAELLQGVQAAVQTLYEDDDAALVALLGRLTTKLEGLSHFDGRLGEIAVLLNDAGIQLDEAARRLRQYADALEPDPERLQWVEQRIGTVHELARKHRVRAEELPAVLERLRNELNDIEDIDTNMARLDQELLQQRAEYALAAKDTSAKRKTAAQKLAREVTKRMQELGMPGGRFEIALTPLPEGELSAHGLERVEFQVSANAGQPVKPLARVASGGELSRISLALQVVMARLGRIPTLIFDEVDVGVGGRVAEIVGQELRTLGQSRQVLCITHLPQVAALGEHHLRAVKHSQDGTTWADVEPLRDKARVQEIARMLGGIEISQTTIAHAKDMLRRAAS